MKSGIHAQEAGREVEEPAHVPRSDHLYKWRQQAWQTRAMGADAPVESAFLLDLHGLSRAAARLAVQTVSPTLPSCIAWPVLQQLYCLHFSVATALLCAAARPAVQTVSPPFHPEIPWPVLQQLTRPVQIVSSCLLLHPSVAWHAMQQLACLFKLSALAFMLLLHSLSSTAATPGC